MSERLHFQEFQFDKRISRDRRQSEDEQGVYGPGFRVITVEFKKRELPEWARTKAGIQKLLLTAFPKLHINRLQRQRAGRWAQVIELFYLKSWTNTEIADELGETVMNVDRILQRISRTAQGKTGHGDLRVQQ